MSVDLVDLRVAVVDVGDDHVNRDYIITASDGEQLPLEPKVVKAIETRLRARLAGMQTENLQITGAEGKKYTMAGDEVDKLTMGGSAQIIINGDASSPCSLKVSGYQWVTWFEHMIGRRCTPQIAKSLWKLRYLMNARGAEDDAISDSLSFLPYHAAFPSALKALRASTNSALVASNLEALADDAADKDLPSLLRGVLEAVKPLSSEPTTDNLEWRAEDLVYKLPPNCRKPFINSALGGGNNWIATEDFVSFVEDFLYMALVDKTAIDVLESALSAHTPVHADNFSAFKHCFWSKLQGELPNVLTELQNKKQKEREFKARNDENLRRELQREAERDPRKRRELQKRDLQSKAENLER